MIQPSGLYAIRRDLPDINICAPWPRGNKHYADFAAVERAARAATARDRTPRVILFLPADADPRNGAVEVAEVLVDALDRVWTEFTLMGARLIP